MKSQHFVERDVALRNWARACLLDKSKEGMNAKEYLPSDYHKKFCHLAYPRRPLPR